MQMTQEDWDAWEKAMLSGKRKLNYRLADGHGGFCTIGLLIDTQVEKEHIQVELRTDDSSTPVRYDGTGYLLPRKLQKKFSARGEGTHFPLSLLSEDQEKLVLAKRRNTGHISDLTSIFELNPLFSFEEICEILKKVVVIINNYEERIPVCK